MKTIPLTQGRVAIAVTATLIGITFHAELMYLLEGTLNNLTGGPTS